MWTVLQLVSKQCKRQNRTRHWVGCFNSIKQCYPTFIFNTHPEAVLKKTYHWSLVALIISSVSQARQKRLHCANCFLRMGPMWHFVPTSSFFTCGAFCPTNHHADGIFCKMEIFSEKANVKYMYCIKVHIGAQRCQIHIVYKYILLGSDAKYTYCT